MLKSQRRFRRVRRFRPSIIYRLNILTFGVPWDLSVIKNAIIWSTNIIQIYWYPRNLGRRYSQLNSQCCVVWWLIDNQFLVTREIWRRQVDSPYAGPVVCNAFYIITSSYLVINNGHKDNAIIFCELSIVSGDGSCETTRQWHLCMAGKAIIYTW